MRFSPSHDYTCIIMHIHPYVGLIIFIHRIFPLNVQLKIFLFLWGICCRKMNSTLNAHCTKRQMFFNGKCALAFSELPTISSSAFFSSVTNFGNASECFMQCVNMLIRNIGFSDAIPSQINIFRLYNYVSQTNMIN